MKIVAISDIHGHLPKIPECDLLLIAGDICPAEDHNPQFQQQWLNRSFRYWLESLLAKKIVGVAGNHDFVFDRFYEKYGAVVPDGLSWGYLEHNQVEFEGLKIWGAPGQLSVRWNERRDGKIVEAQGARWAFDAEEEELEKNWKLIPSGIDILITHSPPYGIGDGVIERVTEDGVVWPGTRHCGSKTMLGEIDRAKPKLHVFGHIHGGRGEYRWGDSKMFNVAYLDDSYRECRGPVVIDLDF